jgi:O-methyltransferase
VRKFYVRNVRPHLQSELSQQRLKLLWDAWGYAPLLADRALPAGKRIVAIVRMLRIDWNVPHAHKPRELVAVLRSIAQRPARPGEAVVEAGCWMGGSTAKLSVFCKLFGYELHTYDSFEGVEERTDVEGTGTDFSGTYAATEDAVRATVARYGDATVCHFHKGWFADTLEKTPPAFPVRGAYIDCDLVKGTQEALAGIIPSLVEDGWIYSQDYHIKSVRGLLHSEDLWRKVGRAMPRIEHVYRNLARLTAAAAPGEP